MSTFSRKKVYGREILNNLAVILLIKALKKDQEEEVRKELERPVACWRCGRLNAAEAKICEHCNFALNLSHLAGLVEDLEKIGPLIRHLSKLHAASDSQLASLVRRRRFEEHLKAAGRA
jgi:hypothetical protein